MIKQIRIILKRSILIIYDFLRFIICRITFIKLKEITKAHLGVIAIKSGFLSIFSTMCFQKLMIIYFIICTFYTDLFYELPNETIKKILESI